MSAGRVVVVGSLNVDLVTRVQRHPRPGETVAGRGLRRLPGGKGANQALAAARAGAGTSLIGRVGDDGAGSAYVAGLASYGVDVSAVSVSTGTVTGHALIAVDDEGENTIVVVPGANGELAPHDVAAAQRLLAEADVVLLQLEVPMPTVVAAALAGREAGARVVLNPSPWAPLPEELRSAVDVVVVNESERRSLGPLPGEVVTTLGSGGARWERPQGPVEVEAPRIDAVDTTGAGDAFTGALAAALARGAGPADSLAAAVAAGSAAVTCEGAQGWSLGGPAD